MKAKLQLKQTTDTPEMRGAISELEEKGVKLVRTSRFQLKVGPFNFWPDSGTITRDGHPPLAKRGLEAFLEMIPQRSLTFSLNERKNRATPGAST